MNEVSGALRDVVGRLLELKGAAVEYRDPEMIEFIAPAEIRELLGVSEFARFAFGADVSEGAKRITLESNCVQQLKQIAGDRGRTRRRTIRGAMPAMSDADRVLSHSLTLQNAVYRFVGATQVWTRYLILDFYYSAVSDEKRDGLARLTVNLSTGSALEDSSASLIERAADNGPDTTDGAPVGARLPDLWSAERLKEAIDRALPDKINIKLGSFMNSMRRRLDRDLSRVCEYFNDVYSETVARFKKQQAQEEVSRQRLESIRREYAAKVADLKQKYAVKVDVEWVQTQELIMQVHRLDVIVKRRKGERRLSLDWNPLVKLLDPPPCEYSFACEPVRMVCDDALHIVSTRSHAPCSACGKEYCRACSPRKCPKCGESQ